jgi:hypothetical protein
MEKKSAGLTLSIHLYIITQVREKELHALEDKLLEREKSVAAVEARLIQQVQSAVHHKIVSI